MNEHTPVLLKEVLEHLDIKPDGTYVDMTFGRGGHSQEILKKMKNGTLIALDLDNDAIAAGEQIKPKNGNKFVLRKINFGSLDKVLDELNIASVDGILIDLGVSSPQFDDAERGFSYRFDSRLDMRMNQDQALTAYDIVNRYSDKELLRIIRDYGEETFAYNIVNNIIRDRVAKPIETTFELVEVIKKSLPKMVLLKDKHPAKRTFQALRIAVNGELENLIKALKTAINVLKPNGRLVVISYHSLEDRIVKQYFQKVSRVQGNRLNLPQAPKASEPRFVVVQKHAILADEAEQEANPRSRSGKLRVLKAK